MGWNGIANPQLQVGNVVMCNVRCFQVTYIESKFILHDPQAREQQSARLVGLVKEERRKASLTVHQKVDKRLMSKMKQVAGV